MSAKVAITAFDTVTAHGHGLDALWQALMENRTAIAPPRRIRSAKFEIAPVAESALIMQGKEESVVFQLCQKLLKSPVAFSIPAGSDLFLATTVGEIDLLERAMDKKTDAAISAFPEFCRKLEEHLGGPRGRGVVVSAACASGITALALAARRIRMGLSDSAVILAVDAVSEFVLAGFNALMALDKEVARPFDKARAGLSLGDGAALVVLMNASLAWERGRPVLAEVAGWGMSDDAHHITGPSRHGAGLADAIAATLRSAEVGADDVAFASMHGTGTVYNDAMELQALRKIFSSPLPIYGIKGSIGHTLGAAGLIEVGVAARALRENTIPPTVGMADPDPEAVGWVCATPRPVDGRHALCVNAGFGGINAAVCLRRG